MRYHMALQFEENTMRLILLTLLSCVFGSESLAAQEIGFDLQIANPATSIFRLENTSAESDARIVGFSGFIGQTTYNFDIVFGEQILSDSAVALVSMLTEGDAGQGGPRTDSFAYAFSGFESGDRFQFFTDLDRDTGDSGQDFREIYFNNGDTVPNALFSVFFEFGDKTRQLDLLLPDDPLIGDPQVFNFSVSQSIPEPSATILLATFAIFSCRRSRIVR